MFRKPLVLSLISALLLACAWLGAGGWPLLIAFVPLLELQRLRGRDEKQHRVIPWVALTFFLWQLADTFGIAFATFGGMLAAVLINTGLFTAVFALYHKVWLKARNSLAYTLLTALWIATEYIYLNGEISWPWLTLGNAFADSTRWVQWYEYGGALSGSLWVLIVNILIFTALHKHSKIRRWIAPALWIVIPAAVSLWIYAHSDPDFTRKLPVCVIQPNIDPYNEKFGGLTQTQQTDILLDEAAKAPRDTRYFIAPETAIDEGIWDDRIFTVRSVERIRAFLQHYPQSSFVVGVTLSHRYTPNEKVSETARYYRSYDIWYDNYNAALQLDTSENVQIYRKSKLVIGVEKMPYPRLMKRLEGAFVDLGGMYGQLGTQPHRVPMVQATTTAPDSVRVGTAICYESIYGEYLTEYARRGAEALFIITNDGWWRNTPLHRHHFAYARLRAIEMRRWVARSANTGISGIIDSRGDVRQSLGWDQRGVISAEIGLNRAVTLYSRVGDLIGRIAIYVTALSLLYFVAYRYKKRNHLVE